MQILSKKRSYQKRKMEGTGTQGSDFTNFVKYMIVHILDYRKLSHDFQEKCIAFTGHD